MNVHRSVLFGSLFLAAAMALTSALASAPGSARAGGAGSAPAPTSATAAAPAFTPVVTANYSTPKDAVKTFYQALNKRDFSTLRQSVEIPAAQAANISVLLDTMQATAEMQVAASTKFFAAGDKTFQKPTADELDAQLKSVDDGSVALTGSTATLTLAANPAFNIAAGTVKLIKVGGDWKIDGTSLFKLDSEPAAKVAQRVALAEAMTTIARDVTKKITGGTFLTATDAYQDYWTRSQAASQPKP